MHNIPIGEQDVANTLKSLPRTPTEAGIVTVGLKRKLEYKTTHLQQLIDVKKIYEYLHYLKFEMKNKYYKFYDDYNVFLGRCDNEDIEFSDTVDILSSMYSEYRSRNICWNSLFLLLIPTIMLTA